MWIKDEPGRGLGNGRRSSVYINPNYGQQLQGELGTVMALIGLGCQCQWRILEHGGERTLKGEPMTLNFNLKNSRISLQTTRKRQFHVAGTACFSDYQVATNDAEQQLFEALLAIQGRGRSVSPKQLKEIEQAIRALESEGGVPGPTSSPLIEGRWRLIFTTRPGTASPIQRTFVGVDAFTIFQDICLRETNDPRVSNIVQFSDAIGELKVEAAALIENEKHILFRFDRAAFSFKFLPFKVPYPVPFRLLGDEAKGWLDTTYLSYSGNIRISRGNKGTTFVLQKKIEPRQKLLFAISSGKGIEEAIEELTILNHNNDPANLNILAGKWRLLWSSQSNAGNWLQRAANSLRSLQIVKDTGQLENLVELIPGFQLRESGNFIVTSKQQGEVNIKDAAVELGSFKLSFKSNSKTALDLLYLDTKVCIMRTDKDRLLVHVREDGSH